MCSLKCTFFSTIVIVLIWVSCCSCAGEKSKQKCEEYAKYVYTEESSPVMTRRAAIDKVSQCGIVETPLVIGGVAAHSKEFPHMAIIGFGNSPDDPNIAWRCGASLISEKYVLTASHCLKDQGGSPQKVRVGEVDLDATDESETQDKEIKRIIKHPDYNGKEKYNDIALLEMDNPVTFNAFVRPACLRTTDEVKLSKIIATGFGKTNFDDAEGSKKLMKVNLNVLESKSCEQYFKRDITAGGVLAHGIESSQICAGELKGGKDTCQGDSGGPAQIVLSEPYCMYSIVAVVSFGKFCGFANQPAIYTNVISYIEWIENIVWS